MYCQNVKQSVASEIVNMDSCWIVVDVKKDVNADVVHVVSSPVQNIANLDSRETSLDVLCVYVNEENVNLPVLFVNNLPR